MEPDDDKTQTNVVLAKDTMVGHYRIIEKIGAGGMGEVYLAQDSELDRKVALKFLPPHLCQDEDCRKRFKREAQAAAGLNHPNIVTIYEVGDYQGRPYFAMEYVEGRSLKDHIEEGDIITERIINGTIQICDGLQTAHAAGIIHRDIKPSNIILDINRRPRILDFGLAAVTGAEQVTKTGSTMGTVGYMSPEQVAGREIDQRSDLFSIGVLLYELFAGRPPFKRETDAATLQAILHDTPEPLTRYKSGISEELQRIITKLLEKDPALRYQSAAGVISDLKRIARGGSDASAVLLDVDAEIRPSIAVLPFTNLSADPEQEYFCDGIAEEIINTLTHIEGLRVVARTSCFAFKGKNEDIREIGRKLNVDHVLEGSVRKAGNRVRITGQLIKIADGYHLWSERYDRELSDIFEVQDEISIAIVDNLKVKLLGVEDRQMSKRPTENLEAYNLYLKGRHLWNRRTARDMQLAIECLKNAVELDPQFALAYSSLADAYIVSADWFARPREVRQDLRTKAEREVSKALALDNSLAEAHASLAQIRFARWEWDEAESEYLLALQLNPRYATAHHWYALYLIAKGRYAEAIEELEQARELDPLSPAIIVAHSLSYSIMRKHDEAITIAREGAELYPGMPTYSMLLAWSFTQLRNFEEAIHSFQEAANLNRGFPLEEGAEPASELYLGIVYAQMGETEKAKKILSAHEQKPASTPHIPFLPFAALSFSLGDTDRGFAYMERSLEEQELALPLEFNSPVFDQVRDDPRFKSIVRRTGLDPEQWGSPQNG